MSTEQQLKQLFEKDHWSEEEKHWVLHYLDSTDNQELRNLMEEKFRDDSDLNPRHTEAERLLSLIHEKISPAPKPGLFSLANRKRLTIAASIIFITGAAALLHFNTGSTKNTSLVTIQKPDQNNDVAPGHDNALLTLADGSAIVLDSAANGTLVQEGNIKVLKMDGQISYAGNNEAEDKIVYNTMSTARGNQYHLQLADGSKVWLNAASSIRFPTTFAGNERSVEITGEAYFEVTHDAAKPFTVKISSTSGTDGGEVQVLGTHFNINAYDDEAAVRTTLAEGKVKVTRAGSLVLLQPLQQAVWNKENEKLKVRHADLGKELAWKTGMFEFQDDDLPTIMRQLSRWYDVNVRFEGPLSKKVFNGSIRRQASLSQVLQILKLAGVSYTLEGKNVTVRSI
jgi:transmembrane sensor